MRILFRPGRSERFVAGRSAAAGSAAFSLLEVLCAVLVLGVALVGITQGLTTALQSNKDSEVLTKAALFAAGLIETTRAEGYLVNGSEEGDCGESLGQFRWNRAIRNSDLEGLHQVEVVIQDNAGKPVYALQTMLFEAPGLAASETPSPGEASSNSKRRRTP
jgi:prepilin-type N-terminal cleavage/methylation domain-containing protein